jgi:2-polyprenyl-6-methoxyphenol hydroxylase-like FAD-dependent oxidoreductase
LYPQKPGTSKELTVNQNQQVLIAGAGPVGLMLACELGLAGVPTVVLERAEQPSGQSLGMAINPAVVELLTQRDLMEPLRNDGFEFPMAHFAHIWLDPARLSQQHPYNFAVPHSQVARRLAERAVAQGVDIRQGHEVTGVDQDGAGVAVEVRSATGPYSLRGSFLVGCDGARSTVRELAGIGFPGTDIPFSGITGDLDIEPDDPLLGRLGVHQCETGFVTIAPAGESVLRFSTGEFGVETCDVEAPVSNAELRAAAERISGVPVTTGTPRWLARWNVSTRQADRYRAGRVFLAGDAAHVHFPLGGQALSTGIEDAVNLGWKLAADLHGWAPAGLLDTYHGERHPVGARACLTTRAQVAMLHSLNSVGPLRDIFAELAQLDAVNEYLVEMVGGLDVRYPKQNPDKAPHELLGRRLPDIPLATATEQTTLASLLHAGRGVLLDLSEGAAAAEAVSGWADRIDTVYAKPTPEIDATGLLLRPDGRVAWAAAEATGGDNWAQGLQAALGMWFGEPR